MGPVHPVEHELALVVSIEDDSDAVFECARAGQHVSRSRAGQDVFQHRPPRGILHDRAVVHDQRDRKPQRLDDVVCEVVAAAGHERDDDPARRGLGHRIAVGVRQPSAAVEQRAIDVDGK